MAATRCSPTCISPTRPCRRACAGCSTASSRPIPRPRPTSPRRVRNRMRERARGDAATEYEAEHPVVRIHLETGRKALYVNGGHTVRFADMTQGESAPLLFYLFAHQTRPEFTCRFRWEKGSLAFWDNRCAQHNPINDYHGFRRAMHRVTLAGDRRP